LQNGPGCKGAANQLTNINVAIDHLLQCDGAGSSSYVPSGAKRESISDPEVPQVFKRANEALRRAMEAIRNAQNAEGIEGRRALKSRAKYWAMSTGFLVLFVLPLFLYSTTTLFSSGQADASDQEPASFNHEASGISQSYAAASSPEQPAPGTEEHAIVDKEIAQPEEMSVTSPTPVSTANLLVPASMAGPPAVPDRAAPENPASMAVPEEAQLKEGTFQKYCGVNPQEWNLSCQKSQRQASGSFRPGYVRVKSQIMDHQVPSDVAPTTRAQYGLAQRTAPFGYAAIQRPEAQPISRANTLILSNGTAIYVTNVWYSGERVMFTMPNGSRLFLGLEQVNFRSTIQANHQVGVNFDPPRGYPSN
jgi:hypothetical protein